MNNDIYIIGEIGYEVTLETVIKSVEGSDKTKPLDVYVHSIGGGVFDGLAIYNYFKGLDQEVNTVSAGIIASVASIIFLAGKKETRIINENDSFLIHLPSTGFGEGGNAEDLEKQAKQLREIEGKFSKIYAEETGLTEDEALELMKKDEFLEATFLLDKGFVSEIVEFKAVAKFNKNKNNIMSELTKEDTGFLSKHFGKLKALLNPKAKLITDANGAELDFKDVADDATPKVGDMATVEGTPAEGDYTMPSDDEDKNGEVWSFTKGELMKITPPEDEGEGDEGDAEALKTENDELKETIKTLEAQAKIDGETLKKTAKHVQKIEARMGSKFKYTGKTIKKGKEDPVKNRSFHGPDFKG